jgi:hypothetical protein
VRPRWLLSALLALSVYLLPSVAGAKDFRPGDLRLCESHDCVEIVNQGTLDSKAGGAWRASHLSLVP